VCAVKHALMTPVTNEPDLLALGRHEVALWSESLKRLIAFRDDGREDRFFDVDFAALQADPIGAVEDLYREMGDELTPETRQRMLEWWETSAADRRSAGVDPSAFGLDAGAVREQFAFYHDRFGLG
jgi:sulfotransferase family protein